MASGAWSTGTGGIVKHALELIGHDIRRTVLLRRAAEALLAAVAGDVAGRSKLIDGEHTAVGAAAAARWSGGVV